MNTTTYSLPEITDLQPGDHLCCLYDTDEEHRAVLTTFLRQGLEKDEKVLYIVDTHTAETVLGYLRLDGLELEPYFAREQLNILKVEDAYTRGGGFDPDTMIALLKTETSHALDSGFSALRVTGEMTWVLRGLPGSERLIEYEAKLNDFFPGSKCSAICQYDRRRFDAELLLDILATHPIAVVGTELFDNFYYMPPKDFLGHDPAVKLDHWLHNLVVHKRSEEMLQASEEKFRLVMETIQDVFWMSSPGIEKMIYVSQAYEKIWGRSRETLYQSPKSLFEAIHPEDQNRVLAEIKEHMEEGWNFEYRITRPDGSLRWIQDRGFPIRDGHGNLTRMTGVATDITERKRLEKTLAQKEKVNTLGAIAAEVAHEIRNPLVSIGGFARRLKQLFPNLTECDIILSETMRLEKILSRIRNYLKPVEIIPQECSVNTIVTDCVELLSPEIKQRQITYKLDLVPSLSVVYTDPEILAQIFINLIRNAAEAMDKEGLLIIETFEDDQDLHIKFKNQAPELKAKQSELLFIPFSEGGETIGLPLCYRLLKDMGGLLSFNREKDYMVFTVSLPRTM
jgi:PAS domain S-box-containing protein